MAQLMLWRRGGNLVYMLDGLEVRNASRLEVRLPNREWVSGRVSWDGDAYVPPILELDVYETSPSISLQSDMELRWPSASTHRTPRSFGSLRGLAARA